MIASYADRTAGTGIDIGSNEGVNSVALALAGLKVRAVEVMEKACEPVLQLAVPVKVDARAADNWDEAH